MNVTAIDGKICVVYRSTRLCVLYSSPVGHKHLHSVVLTLGSINPQKGQKWGVFPRNFTEVQENRKFRNYHATLLKTFDTKVLKRRIFLPFPMYLQADKHGDFCAIFEWRFGAPNNVRT